MPQLDPSSYISQFFWMLVCFCTLWALLSLFVIPKIADIIEQRKRKIDEYIQKADALNKQAKESLEKYHAVLVQAEQTSQAEMQKGKDELNRYLHNAEADLSQRLNKKIADNEFTLAKEKKDTLQQIETIAVDLAYEIVQKLGFSQISKKDVYTQALKEKTHE
ncbi:MAG: hypothetical protein IJS88_03930 [Alphaproteobacteria bacterium]|nr:hypothetical protein [Alphaproteobacteria bacterium]